MLGVINYAEKIINYSSNEFIIKHGNCFVPGGKDDADVAADGEDQRLISNVRGNFPNCFAIAFRCNVCCFSVNVQICVRLRQVLPWPMRGPQRMSWPVSP